MGRADYWKPGAPNAICDVCGFKYKLDQLKKRWDGAMVCPVDWEPRHPQDFVKGAKETSPIFPDARPEPSPRFTNPLGPNWVELGGDSSCSGCCDCSDC